MTKYVIASIGKQLNIPKSTGAEGLCQVAYSAAGQLALASLWDRSGSGSAVSIQYFKNRIAQILTALEGMYPALGSVLPEDRTDMIEEIYAIYLRNGFCYHAAYRLSPAAPAAAGNGETLLRRGSSPDEKLSMSGLGFYSQQESDADRTVADMFCLQTQSFETYLEELLAQGKWTPASWPDGAAFLRLDPPFSRGYWLQKPGRDNRISLARYGEGNKVFAFCRYENGTYYQMPIPPWRLQDCRSHGAVGYGEYRRIAASLLNRYGTLPDIQVNTKGSLAEIRLGYRLPPSEEDFFKLYSWPVEYSFSPQAPEVFQRKMAKPVYRIFKSELESIGYRIVEE